MQSAAYDGMLAARASAYAGHSGNELSKSNHVESGRQSACTSDKQSRLVKGIRLPVLILFADDGLRALVFFYNFCC